MTLSEETEAIFCIGSNCGDRELMVDLCLEWLSGILTDMRHSPIYLTPDCHGGARKYMNAVASGFTTLTPSELDRLCKQRELACGRDDAARAAGDVPLDIDLVVYGREILREKDFNSEFFIRGFRDMKHPHRAAQI